MQSIKEQFIFHEYNARKSSLYQVGFVETKANFQSQNGKSIPYAC